MLSSAFEPNIFFSTKLVNLYAMCDSLPDERLLFDKIPTRNLFYWNAMLRGYMRNGMFQETLGLYYQIRWEGVWLIGTVSIESPHSQTLTRIYNPHSIVRVFVVNFD